MPSRRYVVRIKIPVLMSPLSEIMPTAPPYQPRASFSSASIACAAARFVVAVDVGAHRKLRLFLGGLEKLANVVGVAQGIAGALRGSRDRACFDTPSFDAHEHFGRCAHQ